MQVKFYYGRTIESTECSDNSYLKINNCGWFENIKNNTVNRKHGRIDYQLIYVKYGEITIITEKASEILTEGCIYLYRPGEMQLYSINDKSSCYYWVHFTGRTAEELLVFYKGSKLYIGDFPEFENFCKSFYSEFHFGTAFNEMYYSGYLISLFGLIIKKQANKIEQCKKLSKIKNALAYLEENYTADTCNEYLALLCNMSKYHFIKTFKEVMGMPPHKYITQLVIDKSKQLLEHTDMKISEIASEVGFDDSLYFSRLFKKECGCSPLSYRNGSVYKCNI